jgi:hypothetical protein
MVRENPDPYLVFGVSPTATQAEITHAFAPGYAPSTPTHVRHPHRIPPTNTYDNCWPPTPCSVPPPAEPTTTAQPPTPPYHHTAQQGRHRFTGPPPARSRSRSRTATPPHQPTPQHRHCGPARCAAIGSNDPAKQIAHLNRLEPNGRLGQFHAVPSEFTVIPYRVSRASYVVCFKTQWAARRGHRSRDVEAARRKGFSVNTQARPSSPGASLCPAGGAG